MTEIVVFLGTAIADNDNHHNYPLGEKHAVIAFVRQPKGASPDFIFATQELEKSGWSGASFSEAAPINVEVLNSVPPLAVDAFEAAVLKGFGSVAFSDPL